MHYYVFLKTSLHLRCQRNLDFFLPLLQNIQTNCSQVQSLIITYCNHGNQKLWEIINLIQEHLPTISSVTLEYLGEDGIGIRELADMFDFKNLQKLVLELAESPIDANSEGTFLVKIGLKFEQKLESTHYCITLS